MKTAFAGQREGEKLLFLFRRHILTVWKGFLVFLIFLTLGILAVVYGEGTKGIWIIGTILMGMGGIYLTYHLIMRHYTVSLVTNERLRQILHKGIFRRTVMDLDLDTVQSLTYDVSGLGATLFGYGTLVAQTAAGDLTLRKIAHVEEVYEHLQDAVQKAKRRKK